MGFMIRQVTASTNLADEAILAALETAVPQAVVRAVIAEQGVASERRRLPEADLPR